MLLQKDTIHMHLLPPTATPNNTSTVQAMSLAAGRLSPPEQSALYEALSETEGGDLSHGRATWFACAKGVALGAALAGAACYFLCKRSY